MNIAEAKQEIKHTVRAYLSRDAAGAYRIPELRQRPLLLMGPPGIGKTQIMEQIASEERIGLVSYTITHHTRQSAVGLPVIKEEQFDGRTYSVTAYTMSEIIASVYRAIRDEGQREGILFLDEINCVSETLVPAMLKFLQEKTFGNEKLPSGWILVCAGNPSAYNRSVREFDVVTLDRVRYLSVEADLSVWTAYARERNVHPAILAYLAIKPDNFYRIETDVDGLRFVTARGWEDLGALMSVYEEQEVPVTRDVVAEYLHHEEVAEDVAAFLALYFKYRRDYGIAEILSGAAAPELYERAMKSAFDERATVVNLLLEALHTRIHDADRADEEKDAALTNTFAFLEDAYGNGPEMVLFVTGLSLDPVVSAFLARHPNERFLQYSDALLSDRKRTELLARIVE